MREGGSEGVRGGREAYLVWMLWLLPGPPPLHQTLPQTSCGGKPGPEGTDRCQRHTTGSGATPTHLPWGQQQGNNGVDDAKGSVAKWNKDENLGPGEALVTGLPGRARVVQDVCTGRSLQDSIY